MMQVQRFLVFFSVLGYVTSAPVEVDASNKPDVTKQEEIAETPENPQEKSAPLSATRPEDNPNDTNQEKKAETTEKPEKKSASQEKPKPETPKGVETKSPGLPPATKPIAKPRGQKPKIEKNNDPFGWGMANQGDTKAPFDFFHMPDSLLEDQTEAPQIHLGFGLDKIIEGVENVFEIATSTVQDVIDDVSHSDPWHVPKTVNSVAKDILEGMRDIMGVMVNRDE